MFKYKRLVALLSCMALSVSLTVNAFADEESDLRRQIEQQRDSLNANRESTEEKRQAQDAVNTEISNIDARLVELMANVTLLTAQLEETQAEVEIKSDELVAAQGQCDTQLSDMGNRIQYIYEKDYGMSWIGCLAEAESFSDFLNRVHYTQEMNRYDREQLGQYKATVEETRQIKAALEEKTVQLADETQQLSNEEAALNETLEQKKAESDNYEAEILQLQDQADALNASIAAKNQRVAEIQEEKRRAAEEAARAEEERRRAAEAAAAAAAESAQNEAESQPAQEQPSSSSSSSPSPAPSVSPGSIGAPSGDAAALAQAYANQYADGRYRDRVARYNAQAAAVQRPGIGSEIASLGMNYVGRLHYVVAGESLSSGADCAGFVCALYRCFGVDLERNLELFSMLGVPVTPDPSCMQPGDIVLYYAGGGIGHVALYVGNGIIVNESGCYGNGCVNDCCTRAFNYRSIASVRRVFCY